MFYCVDFFHLLLCCEEYRGKRRQGPPTDGIVPWLYSAYQSHAKDSMCVAGTQFLKGLSCIVDFFCFGFVPEFSFIG